MATRILTELRDDVDGSEATQTIRFALDGVEYEIDLSDCNANRLRNSLAEFVGHARKVSGRRGRASSSFGAGMSRPAKCGSGLGSTATRYPSEAGFRAGCNRSITTVTDHWQS
jgi:Lsr2